MNIDPAAIERALTPRTRAIIAVHFAGRACRMDEILALAKSRGLFVVEDCAHAIETLYHGRPAGTLGDVGAFSFYATKNLCTGEGGMVLARDAELSERVRLLSMNGMSRDAWKRYGHEGFRHYAVEEPGFKYNMTDLQAAFGIHQLARVEANWRRRLELWRRYDEALAGLPVFVPPPAEAGTRHALHMYNALLDIDALSVTRDDVLNALNAENIGVGVHYLPVHAQPWYRETFGYSDAMFPNATWIGTRTLSLPLTPSLSDQDLDDVVQALTKILGYYRR
jgi:dTDP-4-amino-4,6-dideoxygalactose transaminase